MRFFSITQPIPAGKYVICMIPIPYPASNTDPQKRHMSNPLVILHSRVFPVLIIIITSSPLPLAFPYPPNASPIPPSQTQPIQTQPIPTPHPPHNPQLEKLLLPRCRPPANVQLLGAQRVPEPFAAAIAAASPPVVVVTALVTLRYRDGAAAAGVVMVVMVVMMVVARRV